MSVTSTAKTTINDKAAMVAEIDYMLAEMKKADVRIAAHQAQSDALTIETQAIKHETRAIKERTRIALDALQARQPDVN